MPDQPAKPVQSDREQPFVRWQIEEFELLTISPCENMLAVYAEEDEESDGRFKLAAYPIRFLAIAKRTTRFFEKPKDAPEGTCGIECESPEIDNLVVGLDLTNGYFEVCNDHSNFAGYCYDGEDLSQATGFLHVREYPLST